MSSEMYKLIVHHYAIGKLKPIVKKKKTDFPFLFLFYSGFSEDQFKYFKKSPGGSTKCQFE